MLYAIGRGADPQLLAAEAEEEFRLFDPPILIPDLRQRPRSYREESNKNLRNASAERLFRKEKSKHISHTRTHLQLSTSENLAHLRHLKGVVTQPHLRFCPVLVPNVSRRSIDPSIHPTRPKVAQDTTDIQQRSWTREDWKGASRVTETRRHLLKFAWNIFTTSSF